MPRQTRYDAREDRSPDKETRKRAYYPYERTSGYREDQHPDEKDLDHPRQGSRKGYSARTRFKYDDSESYKLSDEKYTGRYPREMSKKGPLPDDKESDSKDQKSS